MYFDEFKHQLPDIDPAETDDWMTSLDQVVEQEGETRARFLVYKLLKRARQLQIGLPPLTQTSFAEGKDWRTRGMAARRKRWPF